MKTKNERGRPLVSKNICVIPEFHEKPDIEKLGRALIAVANRLAEEKKAERNGKGDTVP